MQAASGWGDREGPRKEGTQVTSGDAPGSLSVAAHAGQKASYQEETWLGTRSRPEREERGVQTWRDTPEERRADGMRMDISTSQAVALGPRRRHQGHSCRPRGGSAGSQKPNRFFGAQPTAQDPAQAVLGPVTLKGNRDLTSGAAKAEGRGGRKGGAGRLGALPVTGSSADFFCEEPESRYFRLYGQREKIKDDI